MRGILRIIIATAALCPAYVSQAISFEGTEAAAVRVEAGASTGLEGVYVIPATAGVTIVAEAGSASSQVTVSRFSNLGGAYGEPIAFSREGATVKFAASAGDMGYIVEESGRQTAFWVVDYSQHTFEAGALGFAAEQDCDRATLTFSGKAAEIPYYSINGRRLVLSRELEVENSTLRYDEGSFGYVQGNTSETLQAINGGTINVSAPLCNTIFTLTGDRFLRAWGREESVHSDTYTAVAVAAESRATQSVRENDNEQGSDNMDGLGGSAPCEIHFEACVSDAAIFREWQISRDPDFGIPELTFNELDFDYTFTENGTTYVRFVANNNDGTCEYAGETYSIFIGESKLLIPNAFSPQGSPGVNDEWKVSYKSLVRYECHIFNRLGKELFSSTDPGQGWDGKYGGKFVPAGVYFYVITAEGADGVKYKRSGDINIINYKQGSTSSGGGEATE